MKFGNISLLTATAVASCTLGNVAAVCTDITPTNGPDIRVKVTEVGSVPVVEGNTDGGKYNMNVAGGFDDMVVFIDQKEGKLFSYKDKKGRSKMRKLFSNITDEGVLFSHREKVIEEIYDITDEGALPEGVGVDLLQRPYINFNDGNIKKIHQVAPGPDDNSIIVVFTSKTLPSGYSGRQLEIPSEPEYRLFDQGDCSDISACENNPGPFGPLICCTSQKVYKLFYKFDLPKGGPITNPKLFFAHEIQSTYGHDGGGMLTVPDGRILFAVGDCLPFGWNGLHAPQDMTSHCGKILLLDPSNPGIYEVAAAGVRNSQQIIRQGDNVVFMDIGGVTAEEVNSVPLADLLDTNEIENFGWGMADGESVAREGTFKVNKGKVFGNFGVEPSCFDEQTEDDQDGYLLPFMQFGNPPDAGSALFAISSVTVSHKSFDSIKVAATVFNESIEVDGIPGVNAARLIVGLEEYAENEPTPAYFAKLYKEVGGELVELTAGFGNLVQDALDLEAPSSGDPRLFQLPDGSAAVFIERTGKFYKLEELKPKKTGKSGKR
mmetsp:Transcript_18323/g.33523  ORF Transcript_18323/g.33523 Transcript_18323/m.33523 type:complete len:547 (-) Transcript_18323:129-1769(-)|eukprot:CAMPEP_0202007626 /NCGR_PEP_ID=MMETSP0905-20130828/12063_1 /ASSEMBLY_ACC=CAM_ASM_000554 /TAXON_ID=420261 /ORGANISM="Thalassiosira antarctica, Strain CCMP982" /LENGTH=546 /DNA_ID=CAMNT_0048565615 /DNA_START=94 /DNA_END=1734 /DNA_ORIENTATION=+